MEEIYIAISKEALVNAYFSEISNELNGSWELHIFPKIVKQTNENNSKEYPFNAAIQFRQSGDSYGVNFDYSKISIFSIRYLVNEDEIFANTDDIGDYSDIREQAKTALLVDKGVDLNDENAIDAAYKEFSNELLEAMDKCEAEAIKCDRELIASAIREYVDDSNLDIRYYLGLEN